MDNWRHEQRSFERRAKVPTYLNRRLGGPSKSVALLPIFGRRKAFLDKRTQVCLFFLLGSPNYVRRQILVNGGLRPSGFDVAAHMLIRSRHL
jgi:hypothetical protein